MKGDDVGELERIRTVLAAESTPETGSEFRGSILKSETREYCHDTIHERNVIESASDAAKGEEFVAVRHEGGVVHAEHGTDREIAQVTRSGVGREARPDIDACQ